MRKDCFLVIMANRRTAKCWWEEESRRRRREWERKEIWWRWRLFKELRYEHSTKWIENISDKLRKVESNISEALQVEHTCFFDLPHGAEQGDYLGIMGHDSNSGIVAIYTVTKSSSLICFKKRSSNVTHELFHATISFFLVATLHHV